jgi:hypothetical protein
MCRQSALAIIFISQLVVGNFTEVLMPWFLGKLGVLKAKVRDADV